MSDYPPYPDPSQGGHSQNPDDPNNPYRYGMPAAPPPAPGYGYGHPQQTAPQGPRPQQVSTAVRLMYLRAAIGVVSLIVLFATQDDLKRRIRENSPTLDNSAVSTALTIGAVFGVVLLVLYVLLAMQVAKGRNWARIVTWVIGGLAILAFLGGLASAATPFYRVLGVLTVLIDITVVALLALGPSNAYFSRPRY
jgi:hypothetical protein